MTSNPCDLPSWLILLPEFCTEQNQPHSVSEVGTPGRVPISTTNSCLKELTFRGDTENQTNTILHKSKTKLQDQTNTILCKSKTKLQNQTNTILRKSKTKPQLQAQHKQNL